MNSDMAIRIGDRFGIEPFNLVPPGEPRQGGLGFGIDQGMRPNALYDVGVADREVEAA